VIFLGAVSRHPLYSRQQKAGEAASTGAKNDEDSKDTISTSFLDSIY
jgi:hypothetical protein